MKKLLMLIVFLILASFGVLFAAYVFFGSSHDITNNLEQLRRRATDILTVAEKAIRQPPPLRASKESPSALLTQQGVFEQTNVERTNLGLRPLGLDEKLNSAANAKIRDMFAKQYFAHTSPEGKEASNLATDAGYAFIAIGENLALGNFENDKALVEAWMQSPGHRANIVDTRFQEIGIGVQKGVFENNTTWLAVQIFGKPQSACPRPSESVKTNIENNKRTLQEMEMTLSRIRQDIEDAKPKQRKDMREIVDSYNAQVLAYNALAEDTEKLIATYNQQVSLYNACIAV